MPLVPTLAVRRAATAASLIIATLSLTSTGFAQTNLPATRVQRPIAEDPAIDEHLVARLPGPAHDEPGQQIASLGPAMRPLVREFNSIWPTRGEITTFFGEVDRLSPRGHSGVDIAAPEGTPVLAADLGEVLKAYWNQEGYGGLVIIGHPSGFETWYGHLESFEVEKGQRVKRGEQIGLMGSTGYSTGAHLHFEVRQDGQLRDPLAFLWQANLQPANQ